MQYNQEEITQQAFLGMLASLTSLLMLGPPTCAGVEPAVDWLTLLLMFVPPACAGVDPTVWVEVTTSCLGVVVVMGAEGAATLLKMSSAVA